MCTIARWRALQALEGPLDQVLAALHQHLDGDVVGDAGPRRSAGAGSRSRAGGRREPDLDLLEADRDQRLEHAQLRVGSIGSISAWLPSRRSTEHQSGALSMVTVGPRAIGQHERHRTAGTSRRASFGVTGAGGMADCPGVGCEWVRCPSGSGPERPGVENDETPRPEGGGCGRTRVCGARPT